jgi:hypothetical protein
LGAPSRRCVQWYSCLPRTVIPASCLRCRKMSDDDKMKQKRRGPPVNHVHTIKRASQAPLNLYVTLPRSAALATGLSRMLVVCVRPRYYIMLSTQVLYLRSPLVKIAAAYSAHVFVCRKAALPSKYFRLRFVAGRSRKMDHTPETEVPYNSCTTYSCAVSYAL